MRVLIVTDKYYPRALANAICAQNVAKAFVASGDTVDMLVYQDSGFSAPKALDGVSVTTIKPDLRLQLFYYARNFPEAKWAKAANKTASFMAKSKKALLLPWMPLYSLSFPARILAKMESMHKKQAYDLVISVFASFENALSGMWFKQRNPECKWCMYVLDTFITHRQTWLPEKWRRTNFWLPRFLNTTDLFIYMKSREHEYKDTRFDQWRHKMKPSDIPLLEDKMIESNIREENECETWVYAGSLGKPHYDVGDAIKCFLALPNDKKRELHFYASGEGSEEIRRITEDTDGKIICNGYISHDELIRVYKAADVLFSLKTSDQISAKTFEYMNYNKRIVHFSGCKEDPNQRYIEKFAKGIVIRTYQEDITVCAEKLHAWLCNAEIENRNPLSADVFVMNTPRYTRELIVKSIFKQ